MRELLHTLMTFEMSKSVVGQVVSMLRLEGVDSSSTKRQKYAINDLATKIGQVANCSASCRSWTGSLVLETQQHKRDPNDQRSECVCTCVRPAPSSAC